MLTQLDNYNYYCATRQHFFGEEVRSVKNTNSNDNDFLEVDLSFCRSMHFQPVFNWGVNDDGAKVLAFAILLKEYGFSIAWQFYKKFAEKVIATLDTEGWALTSHDFALRIGAGESND
jgi:hypothetical protein